MDYGSVYILMCEKATEIQPERKPITFGDKLFEWEDKLWSTGKSGKAVWLPSQDQLQEMIDKGSSAFGQLTRFFNFIDSNTLLQRGTWTWEQLWLIYVMRWEYNKVWNHENWVAYQ